MNRRNIELARRLRKDQTDAEQKLWSLLRNRQLYEVKFRRQFPIDSYIIDFYTPKYKLGIEADGGQHYEETGKIQDEIRERALAKYGIKILRFSDRDILTNIDGVYENIERTICEIRNSPSP